MLEKLSIGGMSSEECDTETVGDRTITAYRVKLCIWRANEISGYLKIIDKAGEYPGMHSTRGAKTALRVQSMSHGKSDAQPGLPRKMYNLEWLGEQERIRPYYVQDELRVSEEAFDLLAHVTSET